MQEARAALKADDYARVATLTDGLAARLRAVFAETSPALAPTPSRKRRLNRTAVRRTVPAQPSRRDRADSAIAGARALSAISEPS